MPLRPAAGRIGNSSGALCIPSIVDNILNIIRSLKKVLAMFPKWEYIVDGVLGT